MEHKTLFTLDTSLLRFLVYYSGSAPKITELKFNGEHLCQDGNNSGGNSDTTTTTSEAGPTNGETETTSATTENTTPGTRSGDSEICIVCNN